MDMTDIRLEAIRAALQLEPANTDDLIDCAREIEAYLLGTGETEAAIETEKAAA
jgi:uncharacterized protein